MNDKFKNWKSFIGFFLFLTVYAYTVFTDKSADVMNITGYIALYSMLFIMARSESLSEVIKAITDVMKSKIK